MSHVYISESSRRVSDTPEDVMEQKWLASFGERKRARCDCGSIDTRLINSKCLDCHRKAVALANADRPQLHGVVGR